jgi:hypothetical protein
VDELVRQARQIHVLGARWQHRGLRLVITINQGTLMRFADGSINTDPGECCRSRLY